MENIYNYYKSTLEDYNSFQGISDYVLDNSVFHEKVKECQDNRHSAVEQALKDYLYSVHNVNSDNIRKQVRNCKNFRTKWTNKFRAFYHRQGDSQYTDYYFGDERILTAYSNGYICYGEWKAMQ